MNDFQAKKPFQGDRQPISENLEPEFIIPVIHEELEIEKETVETGKVRISKKVAEYETVIDEPFLREKVVVNRVPKNEPVKSAPQAREEDGVLIVPVVREEIVVQKRLVLVEELRISKQITKERDPQTITLLKEEIEVERIPTDKDSDGKTH